MSQTIVTVDVGGTGANSASGALANLGAAPSAAYDQANSAYETANTSGTNALNAYSQANSAFDQANSAFGAANNSVLKAGDTMTGELNVANNLVITGNVGIGTSSPSELLTLSKDAGHGISLIRTGTFPSISNILNSANALLLNSNGSGGIYFETGSTPSERARITSDGNVGIGTSSPASKLDIVLDDATTNTVANLLTLTKTTSGTAASGIGAGILLRAERASGGLVLNRAAIYGVAGTDVDDDGDMTFYTLTDTSGSGFTEKMRLNSAGNLGIGTTSPDFKLDVRGVIGSNSTAPLAFTGGPGGVNNEGTWNRTVIYSAQNNTTNSLENGVFIERGRITDTSDAEIRNFVVGARGGQMQFVVNKDGSVGIGGATPATSGVGIKFPASQSAVSDANTLDDYEEGTFTPIASSSGGTITSYTSNGYYTKIGNVVTIIVNINITTAGTASGDMNISGLPFTSANTNRRAAVALVREDNALGFTSQCWIAQNSTSASIQDLNGGSISWGNGYYHCFSATYLTA